MLLRIPFQELILFMSLVRYILCRTIIFLVRFICCWNPLFLYLGIYKPQVVFLESHLSGYKVKLIFKQHRNPSPLKTPWKIKDCSKPCLYYCVLIVWIFSLQQCWAMEHSLCNKKSRFQFLKVTHTQFLCWAEYSFKKNSDKQCSNKILQ